MYGDMSEARVIAETLLLEQKRTVLILCINDIQPVRPKDLNQNG